MQLDKTISIDTPEGVTIDLTLAGLGSRFIAQLLDTLIKGGALLALLALSAAVNANGTATQALLVMLVFAAFFIYDIVFETIWAGRTPGKRATGIRVVTQDGGPAGFFRSAVRNLLRAVDVLPGPYAVGALSILLTRRDQRLGDVAAGTLVVRERTARLDVPLPSSLTVVVPPGFDATAIGDDHLSLARQFLARRSGLADQTRHRLAFQVAAVLRPLVGPSGATLSDEHLIEAVVVAKER